MKAHRTVLSVVATLLLASVAHAGTIEEMYELKKKQYEDSLKPKSSSNALPATGDAMPIVSTVSVSAPPAGASVPKSDKAMRLTAIYAVGNDVEVKINSKGVTYGITPGMEIDGWRLLSVGDRTAEMECVNPAKGACKKGKTMHLTISTLPRDYGSSKQPYYPMNPNSLPMAPLPPVTPLPPASQYPRAGYAR